MAKRRETKIQKRRRVAQLTKDTMRYFKQNRHDPVDFARNILADYGIAEYVHYETVGSTNDELKQLAKSIVTIETKRMLRKPGTPLSTDDRIEQMLLPKGLPVVMTADEQTAGRGRGNKSWWTGNGLLAMSILLDGDEYGLSPAQSTQLSLMVGYVVKKAIGIYLDFHFEEQSQKTIEASPDTPKPELEIHWPNDVYLNGKKVAGILIEAPTRRHFVIGIGINANNSVDNAPEEICDRVITLSDVLQSRINKEYLLTFLCAVLMNQLATFSEDCDELVKTIEQELHQIGKEVTIVRDGETITGTCLGLSANGSLRIQTADGEKTIVSGVLQ